jgi:hypothetical protein
MQDYKNLYLRQHSLPDSFPHHHPHHPHHHPHHPHMPYPAAAAAQQQYNARRLFQEWTQQQYESSRTVTPGAEYTNLKNQN